VINDGEGIKRRGYIKISPSEEFSDGLSMEEG
jgi:hypothetical protein